jgi:uncharacterized protein YbjQ (UPF0145 family)
MLVTTTNTIEGRRIVAYKGLVAGEAILGANLFRDLFASIRDIVGAGRAHMSVCSMTLAKLQSLK